MKQRTLKQAFTLSGKGLHTGLHIDATVEPAPENTGYVFCRVDLEGCPTVEALAEHVIETQRGTVIAAKTNKAVRVSTIEHALAALYAAGIDNCYIKVNAPELPILDGSAIQGANQIDPSVFIDDDGQAYLFFGQFAAKCARLNPDMRSIDRSTLRDSIITEAEHHFHEGIQAFKRNGIYYLVYADISRRGMPTCLGYATSEHVMGPYTYRGVIVDNFGCDPYVWNNHGSVGELNGQWYVFYHRSTNGTEMLRKSCVEPIRFNPDGTIDEVPMTTSGAAGYLDPFTLMPGWRACGLTGHARIVLRKQAGREILAQIRRRDSALWRDFRFDRTPERMQLTVIPHKGGKVQVFANTLCLPHPGSAGEGRSRRSASAVLPVQRGGRDRPDGPRFLPLPVAESAEMWSVSFIISTFLLFLLLNLTHF